MKGGEENCSPKTPAPNRETPNLGGEEAAWRGGYEGLTRLLQNFLCLPLGLSISFTESLPFLCLALARCLSPSLCLSFCPSLVLCVPLFLLFWLPVFLSSPCPHVSLSLPRTLPLCLYPPWSL